MTEADDREEDVELPRLSPRAGVRFLIAIGPFARHRYSSYLLVDGRVVEVVRVEYDIEREVSLLLSSGYPDARRLAETRRCGRFITVGTI